MRDQTHAGTTSYLPVSLLRQGWLHRALPGAPRLSSSSPLHPQGGWPAGGWGAPGDSTGGRKREFLLNKVRQSHRVRPPRPRRRQKWPRYLPVGETVVWALLPHCHFGALSRTAGPPLGSPGPQGQGTFPNREGLPQPHLLNPWLCQAEAPPTRPARGRRAVLELTPQVSGRPRSWRAAAVWTWGPPDAAFGPLFTSSACH